LENTLLYGRVSAFVSSRLKKSNFIIYQTKVPKSKIQNPKSKIKKSQAFLLRLGTFSSKDLPLALTLSSKVPVGNNADYVEIESHKIFCQFIYAKKFSFRQPLRSSRFKVQSSRFKYRFDFEL